jgi:hypothetical protein
MMKVGRKQKGKKSKNDKTFVFFVLFAFFASTFSFTRRIIGENVSGHRWIGGQLICRVGIAGYAMCNISYSTLSIS